MKRLKLFVLASVVLGGILMFAQNTNAQAGYAMSTLDFYEGGLRIEGYSETVLMSYSVGYYYDVSVNGTLYNQNVYAPLDYGTNNGTFIAEVHTQAYNVTRGQMSKLNSAMEQLMCL